MPVSVLIHKVSRRSTLEAFFLNSLKLFFQVFFFFNQQKVLGIHMCNFSTCKVKAEGLGVEEYLQFQSEFKVSLAYIRPCVKEEQQGEAREVVYLTEIQS